MNYLRKLLNDAEAQACTFKCSHDFGEVDYHGPHPAAAYEALTACDEMVLEIFDMNGKKIAWAHIIPGLEPDEVIADYSGDWLDKWWNANIGATL